MRKSIAIDMDEVIADIKPKLLKTFKEITGRHPSKEEFWGKKVYNIPGADKVREYLFHKGYFRDLAVMGGSQEGIKQLMKHYDVYITTAAMEFRNSLEDKWDWLEEHFPFIPMKNVVFCGYKGMFNIDYMIDDHAHNLEAFKGKGLLFDAYHNVEETRFTRVHNWAEVMNFFEAERTKDAAEMI